MLNLHPYTKQNLNLNPKLKTKPQLIGKKVTINPTSLALSTEPLGVYEA